MAECGEMRIRQGMIEDVEGIAVVQIRERLANLTNAMAVMAVGFFLVGLALHLTVRDGYRWTAPLFYAMPLPVIFVGLFGGAVWSLHRKKKKLAMALATVALVTVIATHARNSPTQPRDAADGGTTMTIAFWNAARTPHPIASMTNWLAGSEVDVLALVEAPPLSEQQKADYLRSLPGWSVEAFPGGRVVFCRGRLKGPEAAQTRNFPNRSSVVVMECYPEAAKGKAIHLLVADLGPDPFYPRGDIIHSIFEIVESGESEASVVLGDFNTPVESVHFDAWREKFRHGATEGGIGYRETWPWFFPVLCIDHLWFTKDFRVRSAERKNFLCSDHSMVVVDVALSRKGK